MSAAARLWAENEPTGHGATLMEYARTHDVVNTDDAERLLRIPRSQASVYLSNLYNARRFERVGKGEYRLAAVQPTTGSSNGSRAAAPAQSSHGSKQLRFEPSEGTITRKILDAVRAGDGADVTTAQVEAAVPEAAGGTVRSALTALTNSGFMTRVRKGVFKA